MSATKYAELLSKTSNCLETQTSTASMRSSNRRSTLAISYFGFLVCFYGGRNSQVESSTRISILHTFSTSLNSQLMSRLWPFCWTSTLKHFSRSFYSFSKASHGNISLSAPIPLICLSSRKTILCLDIVQAKVLDNQQGTEFSDFSNRLPKELTGKTRWRPRLLSQISFQALWQPKTRSRRTQAKKGKRDQHKEVFIPVISIKSTRNCRLITIGFLLH